MRVAIYARVSTLKKEQKPQTQISELKRYCTARRFKIVLQAVDRVGGATTSRPGLNRVIEAAKAREVDAVIVVKLDRLFRSLKHLITTIEEFESIGVKFIATRDQVDMTTPSGRLLVQILGSLGEFERELIRERICLGLESAKERGIKLGRPRKTDYSSVKKLRKQGLSYTAIQSKLGLSKGSVWRAIK